MKYRTISLNGNKDYYYNLVKYNDDEEYKEALEELRKINKELALEVEMWPQIYDEIGKHRSYMIFRSRNGSQYKIEDNCVGAIKTSPTNNDKNLVVEIQLIEKYFNTQQKAINFIEQLVESLKLYFFDTENIEIILNHDIDLSKINSYKYLKKIHNEKLTYICSNKLNNQLIPKLAEEITKTEKTLTDWKQSWRQDIEQNEFYYLYDYEFVQEINEGKITLPELFSKIKVLSWSEIKSNKSTRNISFSRNGHIEFLKNSNNYKKGIDYDFNYNILNKGFNLKSESENDILNIDEGSYTTHIKTNQVEMLYIKEEKRKSFKYTSPIINNSSIAIELWTNEQNEVNKCYVDFKTHKKNGNINGLFALRLAPGQYYNNFSIRFISRTGERYKEFSEEIATNENELYSTIVDGVLTIELINELIGKIIPIINKNAAYYKKQAFLLTKEEILPISNIMNTETQAINFLKQIKAEIPLPHLQDNLEKFITDNTKNRKDVKKRVLK